MECNYSSLDYFTYVQFGGMLLQYLYLFYIFQLSTTPVHLFYNFSKHIQVSQFSLAVT